MRLAVRSRSYATARICTYTRGSRIRSRASARVSSIRIEPAIERRGNHGGRNGIDYALPCRSGSGDSGLRNFFFSESSSAGRVCVRAGCTHTHVSPKPRDSCVSIISQKSDNWFVNALAAAATYTTDLLRHFEMNLV